MRSLGLIGYGHFGQFIRRTLSRHFRFVIHDPRRGRRALARVLRQKIVIFCVPVSGLPALLKAVRGKLPPSTLVIDVSSVKIRPEQMIRRSLPNPFLSLHPLFGPEIAKKDCRNLPVVVCSADRRNPAVRCCLSFLKEKIGVRLVSMTPAGHDEEMAWVQGLSHFIAAGLRKMKIPPLPRRTGSFARLMEMNYILRNTTESLWRTIARDNPRAGKVRRDFLNALLRLDRTLRIRKEDA